MNPYKLELEFRDRTMTRTRYARLHRLYRAWSSYKFRPVKRVMLRRLGGCEATLFGHLHGVHLLTTYADDYQWTGRPDFHRYRPATQAYADYQANCLCDDASDQVNPELDAMIAYERMLDDQFAERFGY